jgi:beta-lactamase regulating signal transducer with metallopeptidase domain
VRSDAPPPLVAEPQRSATTAIAIRRDAVGVLSGHVIILPVPVVYMCCAFVLTQWQRMMYKRTNSFIQDANVPLLVSCTHIAEIALMAPSTPHDSHHKDTQNCTAHHMATAACSNVSSSSSIIIITQRCTACNKVAALVALANAQLLVQKKCVNKATGAEDADGEGDPAAARQFSWQC